MSNLKLPDLSYDNLSSIAPDNLKWKRIGYQTWVRKMYNRDAVQFKHYDSVIAVIEPHRVIFDTHGYNSRTTTDRLHRIASANLPGVRVGLKQGITYVFQDNKEPVRLNGESIFYRQD